MSHTYPNPLQILLGNGDVVICPFDDDDGHGVLLSSNQARGIVGEDAPPLVEGDDGVRSRLLVPGEIMIHSTNREGLVVLREMIDKAIEAFE